MLFCAAIYFYAFKINLFLFDWLNFSSGVSWIFIPSGLRLLFVLVFHQTGALSIALASCLLNYTYGVPDAHLFNIVTALISGLSPWLARFMAVDFFKLSTNLNGLTFYNLFKTSVLFALISAALHQLWFFWSGKTFDFVSSTFVMIVGDWLGTVLVLAFASLLFKIYRKFF
nr:hypothetical protein [uncultured Limnohabitans sp.]